MQKPIEKPKNRTSARLMLGSAYYTFKRYVFWILGGIQFAHIDKTLLEYEHFCHSTPLLRKLKDVDMYLQYNKITNLKIAVPKVNHVTIHPGETFSYWKRIGRPTKRKGYLKGMVLQNGTFKAGIGGGLCQLSNLIYWMTLHTPLTITERHRHGYDVFPDSNRTQPFGSGATCFYNYGDLMIKNNTDQSFQLCIEITENELKGTWRSNAPPEYKYKVYEKKHIIQSEYWGGYTRHNLIFRKKYDWNNVLIDDEFVTENHAIMMYAPLLQDSTL
ncbi:VanW family protein [Desulfotomaculum sp. 1211_IL3151]|uniref:VanW family protein n=1 Tax=Desulfotomaculum sp. 1211_IL3151 TaxID=3084055 RepID=UPI002FD98790